MATTTRLDMATVPKTTLTLPIWLVIGWQILLGVGCVFAAVRVLQIERIFNLGNFVQIFIAGILIFLATLFVVSAVLMARGNGVGRVFGIGLNFAAAVLFGFFLLDFIGAFDGIDQLAAGLYQNAITLWGVIIGYLVMWVGRRFGGTASEVLEKVGIAIILLSIIALLVIPLWDTNNPLSGLLFTGIGSFITAMLNPTALLVLGAVVAAAAASMVLMRAGEIFNETVGQRDTWQGWLFLMPNFINFMLFFAGPLILSLYLSFMDYNPAQQFPAEFVGLRNYGQILALSAGVLQNLDVSSTTVLATNHLELIRVPFGDSALIIGARDPQFWRALSNTFYYCFFLLLLSIPTALGLAMILNSKIPGMRFFRAIFFIPSVAAVVGVALIWKWLYDPVIGYINYAIVQVINLWNGIFGTAIPAAGPNWLTDNNIIMLSVVIMAAWQVIGFNTVIFLAGLQGVPRELLEAATVDGASRWTRFRHIILPLIGPTTFFVVVTTLISGLQAFSEPYALIDDNNQTDAKLTAVYYLYNQGFRSFSMGYASAVAWALFVIIFVVTLVQFRLSSRSNAAYTD